MGRMQENVARTMITGGWANDTFGSVQEGGHFALIIIEPRDLEEIQDAFAEEIAMYEQIPAEMVGNYIVREDSQGNVDVNTFETESGARAMWTAVRREYMLSYV